MPFLGAPKPCRILRVGSHLDSRAVNLGKSDIIEEYEVLADVGRVGVWRGGEQSVRWDQVGHCGAGCLGDGYGAGILNPRDDLSVAVVSGGHRVLIPV